MDPLTVLGTAGAVANIIDTLGKAIGTLRHVYRQWRDADFTLLNLISQLAALKAALAKIQKWLDCDLLDDQHSQLGMDLDLSLTCCRTLVDRLNAQISGLQVKESNALALAGKWRLVLGVSEIIEQQKFIERQTGALTLLLTACNW